MSEQQLEVLIEYLEGQPELALGYMRSISSEDWSLSRRLWQQCADMLNSVSSDCVQKTAEQWRVFYVLFKHNMLEKVKAEKSVNTATGGAPPSTYLTPLQDRLYTILGRDVDALLPSPVRHNPPVMASMQLTNATDLHRDSSFNFNETEVLVHEPGRRNVKTLLQKRRAEAARNENPMDLEAVGSDDHEPVRRKRKTLSTEQNGESHDSAVSVVRDSFQEKFNAFVEHLTNLQTVAQEEFDSSAQNLANQLRSLPLDN